VGNGKLDEGQMFGDVCRNVARDRSELDGADFHRRNLRTYAADLGIALANAKGWVGFIVADQAHFIHDFKGFHEQNSEGICRRDAQTSGNISQASQCRIFTIAAERARLQ
jgi:hypothetical protein